MSYAIAAYAVVVGALLLYGIRIHRQRRTLIRRASEADAARRAGLPTSGRK